MSGRAGEPPVRVTSLLRNRTWLALAPVAALAFGLAYWGFGQLDPKLTDFERIEKSAQLVKGSGAYSFPKDPWQLVLAQWLVPLVAVLTAAKLFLASLRRDLRVAFAKRSRDHVIVCGLGGTGRRIVELLSERGERVLAVDLDADGAAARAAESLGVPTIPGDAKTPAVLRLAGVARARMVVACTGDDTANLEIALAAVEAGAASPRARPLAVVPEMRADWLFERLVSRPGAGLGTEGAEVRLLNTAENAARLLAAVPAFAAPAILRPERDELAVLGFGDVGRAVAAQALRTAYALPGRRLRLKVFDARGEAAAGSFTALHPGVAAVADLTVSEAKVSAAKPDSWDAVARDLTAARLAAVVVCLPDDGDALYAAARARGSLDALDERAVPVFVRVAGRRKLAEVIARTDATPWLGARFVPFGDLARLLAAGLAGGEGGDALARASHEAYRAALAAPSDAPSARPWEALPELFKRSNRLFADHLEVKLRACGLRSEPADAPRSFALTAADLDGLAAAEHWRWLVERRLSGWRYGLARDDAALRHPLIRDWAELPEDVRGGVRAVVARIPAILARAGREIRRERAAGPDAAALDGFDPGGAEHLVVTLDPGAPGARALALRALAVPHVSLRLAPHGSPADPGFSPEEIERLHARVDGCLDQNLAAEETAVEGPAVEEPSVEETAAGGGDEERAAGEPDADQAQPRRAAS